MIKLTNHFKVDYLNRVNATVIILGLLLVIYRILTLIDSTKNLHGFDFYSIYTIQFLMTFFSLIVILYLTISSPSKNFSDSFYFFILISIGINLVLDLFASQMFEFEFFYSFLIVLNPLLASLSAFCVYMIIKSDERLNKYFSIIFLLLGIEFFLVTTLSIFSQDYFMSSLINLITNFTALIVIWLVLIIIIKPLFSSNKVMIYILSGVGLILGFGMAFGMARRELTKVIITVIFDQTFNLNVVNHSFFDLFNPEFLTILLNSISIFVFIFLFIFSLFKTENKKNHYAFLLICLTGLSINTFISFFRLIGMLWFLFYSKNIKAETN